MTSVPNYILYCSPAEKLELAQLSAQILGHKKGPNRRALVVAKGKIINRATQRIHRRKEAA
jgi:hypothetical protein